MPCGQLTPIVDTLCRSHDMTPGGRERGNVVFVVVGLKERIWAWPA